MIDVNDPEAMFLEWYNNFLTVAYFAEYYELTEEQALELIEKGREIHLGGSND
jgi:hypothetical protein